MNSSQEHKLKQRYRLLAHVILCYRQGLLPWWKFIQNKAKKERKRNVFCPLVLLKKKLIEKMLKICVTEADRIEIGNQKKKEKK